MVDQNQKSRGFGFVTLKDEEVANNLVLMRRLNMDNNNDKMVEVKFAVPKDLPHPPPKQDFGGYGSSYRYDPSTTANISFSRSSFKSNDYKRHDRSRSRSHSHDRRRKSRSRSRSRHSHSNKSKDIPTSQFGGYGGYGSSYKSSSDSYMRERRERSHSRHDRSRSMSNARRHSSSSRNRDKYDSRSRHDRRRGHSGERRVFGGYGRE